MDFNALFARTTEPVAKPSADTSSTALGTYDDAELLALWREEIKKHALENRWLFERQWHRNILYVLGRQWIEYFPRQGGWRDKRLAAWIPRPVTNKCKETVQALRAMFTSIKLGVNVRPNGNDPKNVAAASAADELEPLLAEEHRMDEVLQEAYFWLATLGNYFLHTYVEYDLKYGATRILQNQCACGEVVDETVTTCPVCQQPVTEPAFAEDGTRQERLQPQGRGTTTALSPLELAFVNDVPRFDDVPYVVRLRWRAKSYFENHPTLKALVPTLSWQKSPSNQSLQLFKSLSGHNDLGIAPSFMSDTATSQAHEEGMPEYEVWLKPTDAYPEGLVFRVVGDKDEKIVHLEAEEAIPGPLPYRGADGKPLFPFTHGVFEQVGGRVLGSGPLDVIIQKQDQLNQLDSMVLLSAQRMSNPVWLEPKGAEVEKLTGMPGLVIKWNPLTVGGNAKPERIEGANIPSSLFQLREQYLKDIEELAGTFDIVKGAKPTGVEAFSALQLLVERSQSRFASVFSSIGRTYRDWFRVAIEIEREFGPTERTLSMLTAARQYTFKTFQRTNLQGSINVVVEDGTAAPKTSLGMRAALEHAHQLGMLDMNDPDQRFEGLKLFGLSRLAPSLDVHVQAALQKQQAFEDWAENPAAMQASVAQTEQAFAQYQQTLAQVPPTGQVDPATGQSVPPTLPPVPSITAHTPLQWHRWYDPRIHRQEFLKWANSDRMRNLLAANPALEQVLDAHLQEIDRALLDEAMRLAGMQAPAASLVPGAKPTPSSGAMGRSNTESTQGNEPRGQRESNQRQGPA